MSSDPLIWVNDIHLLMCPLFIIMKYTYANVGLFLHSSFPTTDVFSIFPYRDDILRSMLCCNLIGFNLYPDVRHFLGACRRLLGITHKTE